MPITVLVVDDRFLFAYALGSVIRELPGGELVGIALNGAQALALASSKRPHAIFVGSRLPGHPPEELIPRLRRASPDSRVILLGGAAESRRAGADGHVEREAALEDAPRLLGAFADEDYSSSSSSATIPRAAATP